MKVKVTDTSAYSTLGKPNNAIVEATYNGNKLYYITIKELCAAGHAEACGEDYPFYAKELEIIGETL